ncbi:YraN family protein [Candidatus Daviesbacteria bacterium]|nr:YraN family protein [Candidatus Daviesbacteria bacterium]
MKYFNRQTGQLGEDFAAQSLKDKGFEILKRNFSNKFGEIDIIAKDKNVLVFVEVKTKKGIDFGLPEEMINAYKLQKIRRMAEVYMNGKTVLCRIDVVAIILSETDKILRLNHYENVY